jgi:hypothetical protein
MQLTEEQKQQVGRWISEGAKLSDVQRRLDEEFGVRLTYMETRFLIDDLQLTPQDAPEPPSPAPPPSPLTQEAPASAAAEVFPPEPLGEVPGGFGKVAVKVDEITRPGSVVSGRVTFSDGVQAAWYLDQMGRLGMQADQTGYRPPDADVAEFQLALEKELVKLGI